MWFIEELPPGPRLRKVPLAEYFATRDGLTVLRPGCMYTRRPARLLNPEATRPLMRNSYDRNVEGRTPPEGVARFHDVTCSGAGLIRFPDGSALAESTEHPERETLAPRECRPVRTIERAVHVAKQGNSNYGHFLVEILPRLGLNAGAYPTDVPILLHENSQTFALPMLEHIGIAPDRVEWVGNAPVAVRTLHWLTRNTFHPLNNSSHVFAYLQGLGADVRSGSAHRRLFVTRRDATTRQLLNEDELFAALEPLGFERVTPGWMPFREQVQTFAEASVVVAVCGAALTNLVFMPPGGTVIMLLPATMAGWFFWDVTSHCGIDLAVVWGEAAMLDGPISLDFRVDVGLVTSAVRS